jgi:hypothetical protein
MSPHIAAFHPQAYPHLMKHPLLSTVSAGIIALAIPLQMLAAYASPSALFWAWSMSATPRDVAGEFHLQLPKEQVFVSAWMKGAQEGGLSLKTDGWTDMTVDVVAPKEKVNVRAKLSVLMVDGDTYLKINAVEGKVDQDTASFSAQMAGKRWMKLPTQELQGSDDPFEVLSMHLSMAGLDLPAGEAKRLMADLIDASMTMTATKAAGGNTYTLRLKRHFLNEVHDALAASFPEMAGMADVSSLNKLERELLQQLKFELAIKTDSQDKPLSSTMTFSLAPTAGDVSVKARMTAVPHKGALAVKAPAGAVPLEEALGSLEGSPFEDLLDAEFMGQPARPTSPARSSRTTDPTWESANPCDAISSIDRINAERKGQCGRPAKNSRRHLGR